MSNESFDTTLKKYLYIITDVLKNIYVEYFQIWIIYYKYSRQKVDYPSVVVILSKKLAAECSPWQNRIFSQRVLQTLKLGKKFRLLFTLLYKITVVIFWIEKYFELYLQIKKDKRCIIYLFQNIHYIQIYIFFTFASLFSLDLIYHYFLQVSSFFFALDFENWQISSMTKFQKFSFKTTIIIVIVFKNVKSLYVFSLQNKDMPNL